MIKTAHLLPGVLNKQSPFYYGYGKTNRTYQDPCFRSFDLINALNGKALAFASGVAFYLSIKKKREPLMALLMILSTIFYHLITITAFGYNEYSRLRSPIDLLLNVLVLLPLLLLTLYVSEHSKTRQAASLQERTR